MSVKYVSLALNVATLTVLAVGVVSIASSSSLMLKKRGVSQPSFSIPQIKPERLKEGAELSVALNAYKKRASEQQAASPNLSENSSASGFNESKTGVGVALFAGVGQKGSASGATGAIQRTIVAATTKKSNVIKSVQKNSSEAFPVKIELPKVTVIVADGRVNKAVIDGQLVSVNAQLRGGFVVKEISIDKVIVSQGGDEHVIRIPLERLRVLGAQEQAPAKGV